MNGEIGKGTRKMRSSPSMPSHYISLQPFLNTVQTKELASTSYRHLSSLTGDPCKWHLMEYQAICLMFVCVYCVVPVFLEIRSGWQIP